MMQLTRRCTGQQFRCAPLPPVSLVVRHTYMTTAIDLIDTTIKIGLGAAIAGITSYVLTIRNQKYEHRKQAIEDRRSLAKELALKLEKVQAMSNEAAYFYHLDDVESAKKALVPATGEINSSVAISNILGDNGLVNILEKMAESVDNFYRELNKENIDIDVKTKCHFYGLWDLGIYWENLLCYMAFCYEITIS